MNRESFLETIRQQYADEIREAYIECEHDEGRTFDIPELNKRLKKLMSAAKVSGLAPAEFEEMVRSILPDVVSKLDFGSWAKKAA